MIGLKKKKVSAAQRFQSLDLLATLVAVVDAQGIFQRGIGKQNTALRVDHGHQGGQQVERMKSRRTGRRDGVG